MAVLRQAMAVLRHCAVWALVRAILASAYRAPEVALKQDAGIGPGHPSLAVGIGADVAGRVYVPFDVWRTLRRTGRHSWRRRRVQQQTQEAAPLVLWFDWGLLGVSVSLLLALRKALLQFESSLMLSVAGMTVGFAVVAFYLAVLHRRHGTEQAIFWVIGYLLELINHMENMFVFHGICKAWGLPPQHARKAMSILMLIQIVFQNVCYLGMAATLRQVKFLHYIVGMWLLYTGCFVLSTRDDNVEYNLSDSWLVRCLQRCLGARFTPSYDRVGSLFVVKNDQLTLTMLGPVAGIVALFGLSLEVDVTLTKIEEIPNQFLALTSSVLASLLLPELFFVTGVLFRQVHTLKYGIAAITFFFGLQMLLAGFFVVPAAVSCLVMVATVLVCLVTSATFRRVDSANGVAPASSGDARPEAEETLFEGTSEGSKPAADAVQDDSEAGCVEVAKRHRVTEGRSP